MSKAAKSDSSPVVQKRKFFENDKSPVGGSEKLEVAQNSDTQDIVQDQRGSISNQSRLEHVLSRGRCDKLAKSWY